MFGLLKFIIFNISRDVKDLYRERELISRGIHLSQPLENPCKGHMRSAFTSPDAASCNFFKCILRLPLVDVDCFCQQVLFFGVFCSTDDFVGLCQP